MRLDSTGIVSVFRSSRALVAVAADLFVPAPLYAQTCVDDVTGNSNNCAAEDVNVASVTVLNASDPCDFLGDTATMELRLELVAGASERFDIGIFIAEDGGDAFTGDCTQEFLPPPLAPLASYDPLSGTGPFLDLKGAGDLCGDIEQGVSTFYNLPPITLVCTDTDNNGSDDFACPFPGCIAPGQPSECTCG